VHTGTMRSRPPFSLSTKRCTAVDLSWTPVPALTRSDAMSYRLTGKVFMKVLSKHPASRTPTTTAS